MMMRRSCDPMECSRQTRVKQVWVKGRKAENKMKGEKKLEEKRKKMRI